ncbi:MAG: glycosyltransferase family 39 protein [Proteobacteria bacterium]|nr:glycosyltransferase family 39 protein [Pseudomonadota bacterium]
MVQEMLASHQWLTPMKNGVFYFEKPPLFYWAGIFFSLLSGSTAEWVLRLPSALAAIFATGFLYQRISLYIGRQPALFSALVLISSHFYVGNARRAEINVFFGTLCFTALLLYYDYLQRQKKTYLYLAFFMLGLAALAKGPVSLVFFLPPLLIYGLLRRDWRVFKGLANPLAWLLFAVVGVSWFAYALYGVPGNPLHAVIQKDIVGKVYDNATRDPFYSYFVFLLGSFVPWVLIFFYKPKLWMQRLRSPEGQFLACAIGVPLIIMSCFANKHGKYMLPIFPFLAAFLGWALSDAYNNFGQRWGKCFYTWFIRLAGGILVILFVVLVVAPQYTMKYRFIVLKPFVEKIRSLQGENPVFSYRLEQIQLIYYYGEPIPVLNKEQLKEKINEGKPFLLVANDEDRTTLEGEDLCLLEEFAPFLKKDRIGLLYGAFSYCQTSKRDEPLDQRSPTLQNKYER